MLTTRRNSPFRLGLSTASSVRTACSLYDSIICRDRSVAPRRSTTSFASTALNPAGSPILLPPASNEVHHEAELGLVIGRKLTRATEAEAEQAIFGLTCINDVTARDIQRREIQHTRAKSYDTFACAGPWMVTGLSPADLRVVCRVNGQVKQDGRTSDMVFPPARLVAFISQIMTLLPGDLVSTGTPFGVGPIREGDVVEVEIEDIGVLRNPVIRRD